MPHVAVQAYLRILHEDWRKDCPEQRASCNRGDWPDDGSKKVRAAHYQRHW